MIGLFTYPILPHTVHKSSAEFVTLTCMCLSCCLELDVFNTILCLKQVSFVIYVYMAYKYGNKSLEFMHFSFTDSIQTAVNCQ